MAEAYIQILMESLEKKNNVLDQIIALNKRQIEIATTQPFDMIAYDKSMDEKGELIEELNRLDNGFVTTYERIKDVVQAEPQKYRKKVLILQDLVREATDKGTEIEVQEQRNKSALELAMRTKRHEIKQMKISTSVASKYYKSMSKINDVDPQLMDRKK